MSEEALKHHDSNDRHDEQDDHDSLKGSLIGVFLIGGFNIIAWIYVFRIFISQN